MQFTLTGFTQEMGVRIFAFEGAGEDRVRIPFIVKADLALSRRYGIRLQDLPLMCRGMLERRDTVQENRTLMMTEEEMRRYAEASLAARNAAVRRKGPPKPPSANSGTGWRAPLQSQE